MSYLDRVRAGRYRSPSGKEFTFEFFEVSREGKKKASISESPDRDTPDVQDLGLAAQSYPLTLFFSGADYDQIADKFYNAITQEKGFGILSHPRWGDLSVFPETISQSESFVDGMRRATFVINFIRVADASYPSAATGADLDADIDEAEALAQAAFVSQIGAI